MEFLLASKCGYDQNSELLIGAGADISFLTADQRTALMAATENDNDNFTRTWIDHEVGINDTDGTAL